MEKTHVDSIAQDVGEVLISKEEIQAAVERIGKQVTEDFKGEHLIVIGILKGAFAFMADLIQAIDLPMEIDFMDVSSYGTSTTSSGEVRILKDLSITVEGKSVLIVEDIVDTGLTLSYLTKVMESRGVKKWPSPPFLRNLLGENGPSMWITSATKWRINLSSATASTMRKNTAIFPL